jgi:uncharacterized membrane protein (UPF0136 family)
MKTPAIISYIYGALLVLGGIMGFAMAGSVASLVSGVGGGILVLVAGAGFKQAKSWALPLALVVTLCVGGFFASHLLPSDEPAPQGTPAEIAKAEKKRQSGKTRSIGMTALSALTIIGLLATGRRKP